MTNLASRPLVQRGKDRLRRRLRAFPLFTERSLRAIEDVGIKSLDPALSSPNLRPIHNEPLRAGGQERPVFSLPCAPCVQTQPLLRTRIHRFDHSVCQHGPTAHRRVRGSSVQWGPCSVPPRLHLGAGPQSDRHNALAQGEQFGKIIRSTQACDSARTSRTSCSRFGGFTMRHIAPCRPRPAIGSTPFAGFAPC